MGYYKSRFALGWIANVTLTVVFHWLLTEPLALLGLAEPAVVAGGVDIPWCHLSWAVAYLLMFVLNQLMIYPRENIEGALFITGCDSGMGLEATLHFAKMGFRIYSGCYVLGSWEKICKLCKEKGVDENLITVVPLDVTKSASIKDAAQAVTRLIKEDKVEPGLVGLINCAGIGITGPCEYLPMDMYKQTFAVNYFGYVEVTQAFMPLLKASAATDGARRSRVIFVGTGGGVMTPAPALLSAYMGSKWAGEAFIQCFRMEMQLQKYRIDASMISPAFIKPTNIAEAGKVWIDRLWKSAPPQARDEYEEWLLRFQNYNAAQKGDPPIFVAEAMEEAMLAGRPEVGYKVGFESQASPYAGSLPTFIREPLVRFAMFNDEFSSKNFKQHAE
eukprot:CAMPEP_0182935974 /NCGR_PEP_ID=MMETSP0105_2-20130417/39300_1 /TAXON_ID=81532 ORGANISM="Acanthoeca-like sp., Strain 10tr" /NCGR_SAMPLE_ID=MMETSP0105_2 /ASSEMBLY_ACC=CAM_ASM_000205 /LENGTH=387 /DNA_ID=CAMNT_0025075017 /DNA_START=60 /DNA_END=1223 /DNA_ORIENTATION=+